MNVLVRAFVLTLVATSAIATTQANTFPASAKISIAKTSGVPVPTCPPDDPNACGFWQY